jgi:hypothetical protein
MSIPKEQNWFLLSELSELNKTPKPHREGRLLHPLTRVKFEIPPSCVAVRHVTSALHLLRGNADIFDMQRTFRILTYFDSYQGYPFATYPLPTWNFPCLARTWAACWVQIQFPLHPECISCREWMHVCNERTESSPKCSFTSGLLKCVARVGNVGPVKCHFSSGRRLTRLERQYCQAVVVFVEVIRKASTAVCQFICKIDVPLKLGQIIDCPYSRRRLSATHFVQERLEYVDWEQKSVKSPFVYEFENW